MAKFLLVIAVFIVVYLLLRNHARRQGAGANPAAADRTSNSGSSRHGEDMVRCSVCGVHLPTSEAVTSQGDFFCSREHLQLADRDRAQR
ncbi:MAG TPA: PP0621 family protein [Burkholderiales bacterium]|nr:PP0621 family protein [Burkholderiales bacterium]